MKRIPFERPTEHYDDRIMNIDEQICSLIEQRKVISDHNPGFPPFELISKWAADFGLYEEFLKALFGTMLNEEHFRPMVEPSGFRKYIPVLKSAECGERLYTLNSIRQFNNASVLMLHIDWNAEPETEFPAREHNHFDLFIGEPYDCRMTTGGSRSDHAFYKFVVSPPLPDDLSGIEFRFKSYSVSPFRNMEAGEEIFFKV